MQRCCRQVVKARTSCLQVIDAVAVVSCGEKFSLGVKNALEIVPRLDVKNVR